MNKEYQLINVVFKGSSKEYVFITDKLVSEKDIVYCVTDAKANIGIVSKANVNLGILITDPHIRCTLKEAYFICKSTHDLSSSRNMAVKAIFGAHDTAMYELVNQLNNNSKDHTEEDLPF